MLRNFALLAGSVLLTLGLAEVGGRVLTGPPPAQRALFFSENPWRSDPRGFVTFAPDARIRTAAVYGDSVEYDVTFHTNAQGFIDDRDYTAARGPQRRIAIVGDSFTAGYHGGRPWVPTLREAPGFDPTRQEILNLGVSGTGLANFERLLAAESGLDLDEILIVAIRSDFSRSLFRAVADGERIVICNAGWEEERCRALLTEIFLLPPDATHDDLVARAAGLAAERGRSAWRRFRDQSFLLRILRALRRRSPDEAQGLTALAAIRARFPTARLRLLHLPQKRELREAGFESLRSPVEALGVTYVDGEQRCGLGVGDFMSFDAHPNASGYAKIRRCVLEVLGIDAG